MSGEYEELAGLDLESAREYIFAYAVDVKRLDKDLDVARSEIALWKGRVELARSRGLADLERAAQARVSEEEAKLASLESERAGMAAKLSRLREELPRIRARERSIDPDRLLAELQMMTGELLGDAQEGAAATERAFADLEAAQSAESALAELKRKAAPPDEGGPGGRGPGNEGEAGGDGSSGR